MKIGELSKKTGVAASAIRYYEKMELLVPRRGDNGYREYPIEAVELLNLISQAKDLGLSLNEIKTVAKVLATNNPNGKLRKQLEDKMLELDNQIKVIRKFQKNIRNLLDSNCPL
ncbi:MULTISPECIES: MerR family transcriptional regulator [Halobacteriovorax]|uniref:MerR family transcriptional regulator n=1 Tax=Halobacteriovorax vibrionivorans TaxID=2152716 RepID=A0ABY0IFB1_9BACT|nr:MULTISPECIES: MerR family transcriptional regulator [Halobacteriovorax]RZF21623.1 MerR family transcriptional regulator [Halobacteriovorax vibrionivorans]TGD49084.1 MerR family transcriptional regulator [Halobacteriovorax sp. Y22]